MSKSYQVTKTSKYTIYDDDNKDITHSDLNMFIELIEQINDEHTKLYVIGRFGSKYLIKLLGNKLDIHIVTTDKDEYILLHKTISANNIYNTTVYFYGSNYNSNRLNNISHFNFDQLRTQLSVNFMVINIDYYQIANLRNIKHLIQESLPILFINIRNDKSLFLDFQYYFDENYEYYHNVLTTKDQYVFIPKSNDKFLPKIDGKTFSYNSIERKIMIKNYVEEDNNIRVYPVSRNKVLAIFPEYNHQLFIGRVKKSYDESFSIFWKALPYEISIWTSID